MRKIFVFSVVIVSLLFVACGGQSIAVPALIDNSTEMVDEQSLSVEQESPRVEVTSTPPLPPTFTPSAMAHQGHLYLLPVSGAGGSMQYAYIVRAGDTLAAISGMYGVSMQDVMLINEITDANHIEVGDSLIIPVD